MKKLLKEFLDALIPVSVGSAITLAGIFFMKYSIESKSMLENGTKTVDTVYVHDTVFIQYQ